MISTLLTSKPSHGPPMQHHNGSKALKLTKTSRTCLRVLLFSESGNIEMLYLDLLRSQTSFSIPIQQTLQIQALQALPHKSSAAMITTHKKLSGKCSFVELHAHSACSPLSQESSNQPQLQREPSCSRFI
jgi:hypothetical protein